MNCLQSAFAVTLLLHLGSMGMAFVFPPMFDVTSWLPDDWNAKVCPASCSCVFDRASCSMPLNEDEAPLPHNIKTLELINLTPDQVSRYISLTPGLESIILKQTTSDVILQEAVELDSTTDNEMSNPPSMRPCSCDLLNVWEKLDSPDLIISDCLKEGFSADTFTLKEFQNICSERQESETSSSTEKSPELNGAVDTSEENSSSTHEVFPRKEVKRRKRNVRRVVRQTEDNVEEIGGETTEQETETDNGESNPKEGLQISKEERKRLREEAKLKAAEERKRAREERIAARELAKLKAAEERQRAREARIAERARLREEERMERERMKKERMEERRMEKERMKKERMEKERMKKERLEKEKMEKERMEKERMEKERMEKERMEKERMEKERMEKAEEEEEETEGEQDYTTKEEAFKGEASEKEENPDGQDVSKKEDKDKTNEAVLEEYETEEEERPVEQEVEEENETYEAAQEEYAHAAEEEVEGNLSEEQGKDITLENQQTLVDDAEKNERVVLREEEELKRRAEEMERELQATAERDREREEARLQAAEEQQRARDEEERMRTTEAAAEAEKEEAALPEAALEVDDLDLSEDQKGGVHETAEVFEHMGEEEDELKKDSEAGEEKGYDQQARHFVEDEVIETEEHEKIGNLDTSLVEKSIDNEEESDESLIDQTGTERHGHRETITATLKDEELASKESGLEEEKEQVNINEEEPYEEYHLQEEKGTKVVGEGSSDTDTINTPSDYIKDFPKPVRKIVGNGMLDELTHIDEEVLEHLKEFLSTTKIDLPVDINDPYDLGLLLRHLRHHSSLLANINNPKIRRQILDAMQEGDVA